MEIYFLDKLINFNSTNFETYLKKLDEIKKKLRNDTSEEEEKGEDMNLKDDEDGEGTDVVEKKQLQESHKAKNKKKDKNKNNKIQQQRKKKLNVMTKFFKINLILFKTFSTVASSVSKGNFKFPLNALFTIFP